MRLFLLPPAGASAATFRAWPGALGEHAEAVPVELPGRGGRIGEPAPASLPDLIGELAAAHTPSEGEWAVVGHSMGALLGAGWAAAATRAGRPPAFLVLSASAPPWLHSTAAELEGTEGELWQRVDALGGLPPAIRDNPLARRLFSRALQADVTASARYRPPGPEPVGCPVVAVRGAADALVGAELLAGWSALTRDTRQPFRALTLPGGHFYRAGVDDLIPLVRELLTAPSDRPWLQRVRTVPLRAWSRKWQ
ncbi:putative thioesterase [Streptomyces sp. NBRC 110611]|uniref:thioesterase II family protein n=1 Tax=Streptomyces sp. NBRC 110611 TaxID=1621259 RepID=UPI00082EE3F4|nr:thioesterase domain-containing protein [Streptomyces sp. NBRC 110611]GAU67367.1 putative thioesterase [Streptomyces sp. NBRC 110611]